MGSTIHAVPARYCASSISRTPCLVMLLGSIAWATWATWAASPSLAQNSKAKAAPAEKKKADKSLLGTGLDALKLPANAVVVVIEKIAEGFSADPNQVILSPAAYKKLMARIAELERKLGGPRPDLPSACHLKVMGAMDGDTVRIRAEFKFKAEKDKTLVALGCRGASPQKPELDGKETLLLNGDGGLLVRVDAGQHVLVIELDAAVKSGDTSALEGGAKRVLKIELPQAAVTGLEVEQLPAGVKEVRGNGQALRKAGEVIALGAAKDLTLSWVKPVALPADGPWLTADGAITVRVEEKYVVTEALLTLQDLRKQNARWVLGTPPQTTVEVVPLDKGEPRIPAHTIASDKSKQEHTITLNDPTGDAFGVFLRSRQPRPAGRILVGPYQVLQADGRLRRQQGIIRIKTPPAGIKLIYRRAAEAAFHVSATETTDKDRLDSVEYRFNYWSLPQGALSGAAKAARARPPLLELEARNVTGIVKTRVEHVLELREKDQGWEIQATTRIHAQPVRAGVDVVEVQMPRTWPASLPIATAWGQPRLPTSLAMIAWSGGGRKFMAHWPFSVVYQLERNAFIADRNGPADPIEDLSVDRTGTLRVGLPEKKAGEFILTLKGVYPIPPGSRHVVLELPLVLNTNDQGGEVKISGPPQQQLMLGEAGHETPAPGKFRHEITSKTAPDVVELGWRPYRPDLPVTVLADVTMRNGKAEVIQVIHFPSAQKPLAEVNLQLLPSAQLDPAVARAVKRSLKIPAGLLLGASARTNGSGRWAIPLALREDRTLVVRYEFPLPARGLMDVPLFWLEEATRIETKVRVWSLPGSTTRTTASMAGQRWREGKIEKVPGRDFMPILVLHGQEREMPLGLRLGQAPLPALASAVVERGLIRAANLAGGGHTYRARFRLDKLSTPTLDVDLPPGASRIGVVLDGIRIVPRMLEAGKKGAETSAIRLQLDTAPESFPGPVILEVIYDLGEGAPEGSGPNHFLSGIRTTLYPPVLHGVLYLGKVRWQVVPAPGMLLLNPGGEATAEQRWGLRGWLAAPGPGATSTELERWLTGKEAAAEVEPGLLCWQTAPEPIHLIRVARKTWLLFCSLLFLALGLGLSFAPLLRGRFRVLCWVMVALAGLALGATAILWPGFLPDILYGCEPGLAVLIPIVVVQWMVQKRYRRQLVFMPGFTRLKAGSSLVRAGSSNRPTEPSTVDKQTAPDGSVQRTSS